MEFNGDIIITDPCYIIKDSNEVKKIHPCPKREKFKEYSDYVRAIELWTSKYDDWEKCDFGDNMDILGIHHCLVSDTGIGDWCCSTLERGTNKKLGEFGADAGMVGVFLLSEVLKYNPSYSDISKCPHSVTLIEDFHGTISIVHEEGLASVVGDGNIKFYTKQGC